MMRSRRHARDTVLDALRERATLARLAAGLQVALGHHGSELNDDLSLKALEKRSVPARRGAERGARSSTSEHAARGDAGTRAAGEEWTPMQGVALDGGLETSTSSEILRLFIGACFAAHRLWRHSRHPRR